MWKTLLSDIVRGPKKLFREVTTEKPTKCSATGKQEKGTQGIIHSPSSMLNQMLFFPWKCNWKALISASRSRKMTDLKHFPYQCPHLFLVKLLHKAPVPPLQCRIVCWDRTSSLLNDWVPSSFCRLPLLQHWAPTASISTAENNRYKGYCQTGLPAAFSIYYKCNFPAPNPSTRCTPPVMVQTKGHDV